MTSKDWNSVRVYLLRLFFCVWSDGHWDGHAESRSPLSVGRLHSTRDLGEWSSQRKHHSGLQVRRDTQDRLLWKIPARFKIDLSSTFVFVGGCFCLQEETSVGVLHLDRGGMANTSHHLVIVVSGCWSGLFNVHLLASLEECPTGRK